MAEKMVGGEATSKSDAAIMTGEAKVVERAFQKSGGVGDDDDEERCYVCKGARSGV